MVKTPLTFASAANSRSELVRIGWLRTEAVNEEFRMGFTFAK
jgi:hypothetical protein